MPRVSGDLGSKNEYLENNSKAHEISSHLGNDGLGVSDTLGESLKRKV